MLILCYSSGYPQSLQNNSQLNNYTNQKLSFLIYEVQLRIKMHLLFGSNKITRKQHSLLVNKICCLSCFDGNSQLIITRTKKTRHLGQFNFMHLIISHMLSYHT